MSTGKAQRAWGFYGRLAAVIQFRQIVGIVGWLVAGAAALVAGAYIVALLINLSDRPPSEEAVALLDEWQNRPRVPDARNGYVYVLGFSAPLDADPAEVGRRRAEWIRRLRVNFGIGTSPDPYPQKAPLIAPGGTAPFANTPPFADCHTGGEQRSCFFDLERLGAAIEPWLLGRDWVLERYSGLLAHPAWDEIVTLDPRGIPDLRPVFQAQGVWFLEAWRHARNGDAAAVQRLLGQDLEFWRRVLEDAQTLVMKSVAIGMIERHFKNANVVLARLPAELVADAVPKAWHEPIDDEERSMRRVFAAELRIAEMLAQAYYAEADPYEAYTGVEIEPQGFWQRVSNWTNLAFTQPQDYVNKRALQFIELGEAVQAPYDDLAAELERVRHYDVLAETSDSWTDSVYNFVLNRLIASSSGSLNGYVDVAARTADLEGLRRAAVASASLRGNGVAPNAVGEALAATGQRDPYTGEPLKWQPTAREIIFEGIMRGYRPARHALWY